MSMRHKRSEPKRRGLTSKGQQYYFQDPERSYSLRPFDERLRRYLCSTGSCSRDNQLFSFGRMNFHIIVFGQFLDVIKFVDKSSYARRQTLRVSESLGVNYLIIRRLEKM